MAFKIFDRVGLFKSFDIPIDAFILYFSELENGYIDLPCKNNFIMNLNLLIKKLKGNA